MELAKKQKRNFTATVLIKGHDGDDVTLEMVTSSRHIYHKGEKYFLIPAIRDLGDGNWAKCYLWDGYLASKARLTASEGT